MVSPHSRDSRHADGFSVSYGIWMQDRWHDTTAGGTYRVSK